MVTLSILPLRVSASVGEHSDLETLGKLLTLASDKGSLDTVLDVSENRETDSIRLYSQHFQYPIPADVISDCAACITILLSDTGIAQGQCIGEFSKLQTSMCLY